MEPNPNIWFPSDLPAPLPPRSPSGSTVVIRPGDAYKVFTLGPEVHYVVLSDQPDSVTPEIRNRMAEALDKHDWAYVEPSADGLHSFPHDAENAGPPTTACSMWNIEWLRRVTAPTLPVATLAIRAIRRGARSGRLGQPRIRYPKMPRLPDSAWEQENQADARGLSVAWKPLPGIQVLMAVRNGAPWLEECLSSIEECMAGYRWVFLGLSDGSNDGTGRILLNHRPSTSADAWHVGQCSASESVDSARNILFRKAAPFRKHYKAVCMMDADDIMLPDRTRSLLWRARDAGHPAVFGDYIERNDKDFYIAARGDRAARGEFGPWSTLFHASLCQDPMFWENHHALGDVDLWARWRLQGIPVVPLPCGPVHVYRRHRQALLNKIRPSTRHIAWRQRLLDLHARYAGHT